MKTNRGKSTKGLSEDELIAQITASLKVINAGNRRRAEAAGEPVPVPLKPPERVVINSGATVVIKSLSDARNFKQTTTYEIRPQPQKGARNRYQRADGWTVIYDSGAELRERCRWLRDQMKQLDREQRALLSERRKLARKALSPTVACGRCCQLRHARLECLPGSRFQPQACRRWQRSATRSDRK